MKIVTRIMAGSANMIWIPREAKKGSNHPPRPNSSTAMSPTTTGETARGRSTSAETSRFPGKRSRARTSATITPKNVVTTTVIAMITKVSRNAWRTSGWLKVRPIVPRPDLSA